MGYDGKERRQSPRAAFPCKISVNFSNITLFSHTENLSKGGVNTLLEQRLERMTKDTIELFLKKDKTIVCEGMIMWVRENINPLEAQPTLYNTGIMFTSISPADREYIANLVIRLLSE